MIQSVEGVYRNGKVELLEAPANISEARVIVTFLPDAIGPAGGPKFTREEYQGRLTQHFMGMVLHEGKPSNAVLSCFVDVVTEADQQVLDKLEQLVKAKRRALRRQE